MRRMLRTSGTLAVMLIVTPIVVTAVQPDADEPGRGRSGHWRTIAETDEGGVVRLGGDYAVGVGERADEVVVLFGSAVIEGEVDGDVVVVLGSAALAAAGRVGGDFVVVAGSAEIAEGAAVEGDVVVVGGGLDAPPGFRAGGEQVAIGSIWTGEQFAAAVPWVREGLLWGRPIAPGLPLVWMVVAVLGLVYLAVNVVFDRPVRACGRALAEKPLTTGLAGVLVLLLIWPVCTILAVSVIGLAVVPFLLSAVFIAGLIGRVGAARWLGGRVVAETAPASRLQATRSISIGLALVCLAYTVPVLGFVTWTLLGVFGLGAAATTVVAGLRQENPAPPPAAVPGPPAAGTAGDPVPASADAAPPPGPEGAAAADLSVFPRASFLSRLGALVLDFLLVMLATRLLDLEFGGFFLVFLVYHVALWGTRGTTVGGIICQLRVVRIDGAPIRFTEALVRGLSSIFSAAVAGLGWFWMLWDAERQTWHDRIAGTIVVRTPRNWPQG